MLMLYSLQDSNKALYCTFEYNKIYKYASQRDTEHASHPMVCQQFQSNEYRLWQAGHTLKGVRYREYSSNNKAYERETIPGSSTDLCLVTHYLFPAHSSAVKSVEGLMWCAASTCPSGWTDCTVSTRLPLGSTTYRAAMSLGCSSRVPSLLCQIPQPKYTKRPGKA